MKIPAASIKSYKLFLGISFALLILLMVASGGSIVFLASEIQDDIQLIQDNYTQTVRLIGQVETDVNLLRIMARDMLFLSGGGERHTLRAQIDSVTLNIVSLLGRTQQIVILPQELGNFQSYIGAFDEYVDAIRDVLDLADSGNREQATLLFRTKMVPFSVHLREISSKLVNTNIEAAKTTRSHIESLESRFFLMGMSILILSLGISAFIYMYVSKAFQRYIDNIRSAEQEKESLLQLLTERQKKIEQLVINLSSVEQHQRKRISQELHDGIGHGLTSAKFYLDSAQAEIFMNSSHASEHLNQALETIKSTLAETKRISYDLRPTLLDDLGLVNAVNQLILEFERRTHINVHSEFKLETLTLTPLVEITLFRIIQEAFTNIEKYAAAENVVIQMIRRDGGTMALTISDDGKGFNLSVAGQENGSHMGLRNMSERGELIGGTVLIESSPGMGTEINIEIPTHQTEQRP